MKINQKLNSSFVLRALRFLFSDDLKIGFSDTILGTFLRFSFPYAAEISVIFVFFVLWYEPVLDRYAAFLGSDFLPPLALAIGFILADKKDFVIKKYHLWYLGLLAGALTSAILAAPTFGRSPLLFLGWFIYLQFFMALLLGGVIKNKKMITNGAILVSAPAVIYSIYQFFAGNGSGSFSYLETTGARVSSTFDNPNVFGFLLVFISIIMIPMVEKRDKAAVFFAPILLLSLFTTGSRTAWLGLLLALFVYLSFKRPMLLKFSPLALLLLFVGRIRERFSVIIDPRYIGDSAIDGRIWSLKNSLFITQKHLLLGTGPGTYGGRFAKNYASPVYFEGMQRGYVPLYTTDNQFLEVLVQLGIFGAFAFLGFFAAIFHHLLNNKNHLALALLASFLLMSLFSNALEFTAISAPIAVFLAMGKTE